MVTRKVTFSKQIVSTKMCVIILPSEHKSCLPIFLKKCHFDKFCFAHNHQQNTIFQFFFWVYLFHVFHFFCFSFSNIKKGKQTMHFLLENPFLTPWQPALNISPPTHDPKNTIKFGKHIEKYFGPIFDSTLEQFLTQKRPNQFLWLYSKKLYIYGIRPICTQPSCHLGIFAQFYGNK